MPKEQYHPEEEERNDGLPRPPKPEPIDYSEFEEVEEEVLDREEQEGE